MEACGIVCDECRDSEVRTRGIYVASTGTVLSKACEIFCDECRDWMSETRVIDVASMGTVKSKLVGFFSGKCWGGKVRNLCLDTEMSDRIFSGSKSQCGWLGRWGNRASGR